MGGMGDLHERIFSNELLKRKDRQVLEEEPKQVALSMTASRFLSLVSYLDSLKAVHRQILTKSCFRQC